MNPETSFGRSFRKKLPSGDIMRVENPAKPGTPDLNCCIKGVEFWVEFKQVKDLPKKPDTPVFTGCLEPHQALWHIKRHHHGGRSYIVAGVLNDKLTYIIPGKYAQEFNQMPKARLDSLTIPLEQMYE